MMGLAEVARIAGLFDWLAAYAVTSARGSRVRLLLIVYAAGIVTTTFLSNDATIVVLTPAVIQALRRIDAPPAAYVIACALVANAASFVLPISNPSNLLVFASGMPALGTWMTAFGLPAIAALTVTFGVLAIMSRNDLRGSAAPREPVHAPRPEVPSSIALVLAALVIVGTSALRGPLGAVTFGCAVVAALVTVARRPREAQTIARNISWPVVALTASLFVIVGAINAHGGLDATRAVLGWCASFAEPWSKVAIGVTIAGASNIVNNLPVGLSLGETLALVHASAHDTYAALIGVNLGPNATVNGSLATLLWLAIVRRENIDCTPLRFAVIGTTATIPALLAALLLVN